MEGNKWLELNSSPTRIGQSGPGSGAAPQPPPRAPQEPKQTEERKSGGLSTGAKIGFAGGALAVLGLGGFIALGSGGSDDAATTDTTIGDGLAFSADTDTGSTDTGSTDTTIADDASTTTTVAAADDGSADDATTDDDAAADDAADDAVADDAVADDSAIGADSPPSPPGAPDVHAILANGKIYLRGTLPSPVLEDPIVSAVEQVLGEGNVISEYTFDSSVPFDPGASSPVYIAETVLFASNSAEIWPDFYPLLGIGVTLLDVQPGVIVEVIGHTDSKGDAAANLALSQERVEAARSWMIAQGADPDRIIATGKGETEPRASNDTEEGRQANRRVEFIISGFEY